MGIPRHLLTDGDEMAIMIDDANQSYGHAVKGARVRKVGHYGRGNAKVTVIMFVEPGDPSIPPEELGSIARPRIWYDVNTSKGTTVAKYVWFVKYKLLCWLRENEPSRVFMHDNLSSHKADEVYDAFYGAGHKVICRVPYRPDEAPIEFVFDMLKCEIRRRWQRINNEVDLIREIHDIIKTRAGMSSFDKLFKKCGYRAEIDSEEDEDDSPPMSDVVSESPDMLDMIADVDDVDESDDDMLLDCDPVPQFKTEEECDSSSDDQLCQMDDSGETTRHRRTVRLLERLQKHMRAEGEEDEEPKPTSLSYGSISEGYDRHTVAGVFNMLLQLKTWDFVDLKQSQSEAYSDIKIRAGPRFRERVAHEGKSEDS